jgi:hypothetical protein
MQYMVERKQYHGIFPYLKSPNSKSRHDDFAGTFHPNFSPHPTTLGYQIHTSTRPSNATKQHTAHSTNRHFPITNLPINLQLTSSSLPHRSLPSAAPRSESSLRARRTNGVSHCSAVPAGMRQSVTLTLSLAPKRLPSSAGGGCRHDITSSICLNCHFLSFLVI